MERSMFILCVYFCLLNSTSLQFSKFICFLITYFYSFFFFFFFLISCSSARRTEYNFGRRPMYSAIGVPLQSSFILPITFLFVSS